MPVCYLYSSMPDVATLINKGNMNKLKNNGRTEPCKCNCTDKTNCSLKRKCQFECVGYKGEVHSRRPGNSNVRSID